MSPPLVSVCTPTWRRHDVLLSRCIPSVQDQDHPAVEHVIISDGPDENLRDAFTPRVPAGHRQDIRQGRRHPVRFQELPEHHPEPHWGHYARLRALELAAGEYVTYCDDDDALRPYHCSMLAAALDAHPEAGFALSRMLQHQRESAPVVLGRGEPGPGNTGTPMIMHRRKTLEHGTWGPPGRLEDWEIAERWLGAGVPYVIVDAETSDVWPSAFTRR